MQSSEHKYIQMYEHLGDDPSGITTDAPFVGNQSTPISFTINTAMVVPSADRPPLLFIERLRKGGSEPTVKINGNAVNDPAVKVGPPDVWQSWMINGGELVKGVNTIQFFQEPGGGDSFVIGNVAIIYHVENWPASSGWLTIPANRWENIAGAGSADFTAPQDIDRLAVNSWWGGVQGSYVSEHAVIGVYVDDSKGARQIPFRRSVSGGGKSGILEFRYVFDTNPKFAQWLSPVVALVGGNWDRDSFIKTTYLPSLKWRAAAIPASQP